MEEALYNKKTTESEVNEVRKTAKENFDRWNEALLSKDATRVAGLYSENNTFLPTVSGDFKRGVPGAEEYFKHFLEKDPVGTVIEDEVQTVSNNVYLHSGMYNFEIGPETERKTVEARFTFLWKKDENENWKIVHHHSSLRPKN